MASGAVCGGRKPDDGVFVTCLMPGCAGGTGVVPTHAGSGDKLPVASSVHLPPWDSSSTSFHYSSVSQHKCGWRAGADATAPAAVDGLLQFCAKGRRSAEGFRWGAGGSERCAWLSDAAVSLKASLTVGC